MNDAATESESSEPPRYRAWLQALFGRPPGDDRAFDFAHAGLERPDHGTILRLIGHTLRWCGRDLAPFNDAQVAAGLDRIFNPAFDGLARYIRNGSVPFSQKREAIQAIRHLYADCFAVRCAPRLGHLNETGGDPLAGVCYMLWDVTILADWEGRPDRDDGYRAVVDVLAAALESQNDACVESGLHGLGHVAAHTGAVPGVIDAFLARRGDLRPELRDYALRARSGSVL